MESWVTLIGDTLALRSLDATAKAIGVSHSTAFNIRHKLLVYLEQVMETMPPLEAVIETDETYVLESQKGTPVTHRAPRKHGEGASRRGLSNEQLCVCVATDREHHVAARCVNRAKPSSEDLVEALGKHISGHSVILCDGASGYNLLAEKTGCEKVSLVGHESYSKVYHLTTVNGLHSRFKEMMRRYRGVATKYLNRYAALLSVASMSAALSVDEAVDLVRRDIGAIRLHLTGKTVKCLGVLAV